MPSTTIARWEARRGRQDEMEKTGTGTATIYIHDVDGYYDPSNGSSPYAGQLDGAPVALSLHNPVTSSFHTRFTGYADEYTFDLSGTQRNVEVQINCVDLFDYLASAEMAPGHGHPFPAEAELDAGVVFYDDAEVDARIFALLTDAQIPSDKWRIFSGNVVVQETVYDGGYSFLAAMQDAADAEWPGISNLYVDAEGHVVFHGRHARFDPDGVAAGAGSAWNFTRWKVGDGAAIAGDSSYAQARPPLTADRSLKMVYNAALIYPSQVKFGETAETDEEYQDFIVGNIVTDPGSIAQYGVRSYPAAEVRTFSNKDGGDRWLETLAMGQYQIDNYSQPHTRPRQITVKSVHPDDPRAAATWAFLCGVEISDIIHLNVAFPGGGGIEGDFHVEGITTVCRPLQPDFDYVEVTCDVSPDAYWNADTFG